MSFIAFDAVSPVVLTETWRPVSYHDRSVHCNVSGWLAGLTTYRTSSFMGKAVPSVCQSKPDPSASPLDL